MDSGRLVKVVMLEAFELESKARLAKDLHQSLEMCGWRGLGVYNGTECSDGKESEAAIERHRVMESKCRLERGSNGEVEIRNDWEVDGK